MSLDDYGPGRSQGVFIGTTVTFVIASIMVFMRLVSRFAIIKHSGRDDCLIILAWLLAFGITFALDYSTSKGLCRHSANLPPSWIPPLLVSEYAFTILYCPAILLVKASVLTSYLNFAQMASALRVGTYVMLVIVNAAAVAMTLMIAFQCHPPRAAYDISVETASCISIMSILLGSAAINIATNIIIVFLPIPTFTKTGLPRVQRLTFLFCGGILVTGVNIARIYYLHVAKDRTSSRSGSNAASSPEFSYYFGFVLLWTALEVNLGVTCACIPTVRPFVRLLLGHAFGISHAI